MARVFLSYPNNERQVAAWLAKALQGVGLEPVMDVYDATGGEEVLTHLLYSVQSSDFVLLLTPTKSLSAWRAQGASAAIRQKLKSRNVSIVPVFLGRPPLIPGWPILSRFTLMSTAGISTRAGRFRRLPPTSVAEVRSLRYCRLLAGGRPPNCAAQRAAQHLMVYPYDRSVPPSRLRWIYTEREGASRQKPQAGP